MPNLARNCRASGASLRGGGCGANGALAAVAHARLRCRTSASLCRMD